MIFTRVCWWIASCFWARLWTTSLFARGLHAEDRRVSQGRDRRLGGGEERGRARAKHVKGDEDRAVHRDASRRRAAAAFRARPSCVARQIDEPKKRARKASAPRSRISS